MPVVSISHRTTYRYRNPVAFGEHRMTLRPLEGVDQRLIAFELSVSPEPALLRQHQDVTDSWVASARFDARADRLHVESQAVVAHEPSGAGAWDDVDASIGADPFVYEADDASALAGSIRRASPATSDVDAWARGFLRPFGRTHATTVLSEMTHAIHDGFAYEVRPAGAPQAAEVTLARRKGSCRDFAVLMIDAVRSLGLGARFASGYIYGRSGLRHGHTHAWARVYLPACGWLDFDPTSGIVGAGRLIRVAVAADPRLAVPLHGSWRGLRSDYLGMDVAIDIAVGEDAEQAQPFAALGVAERG